MANDTLANALSKLLNAERRGKKTCEILTVSKVIRKVLELMNEHGLLGTYEVSEESRAITVHLLGKLNNCGAIKPRYSVKKHDFEKFEKRYLPAKDFGIIIVSTPKGITTHIETKKQLMGGRLLAYCY